MCDLEIEVDDPVERCRKGIEALALLKLPTLASLQQVAKTGEAAPVDTAVLYLEAVVSVALDSAAGAVDPESAGRCLIAEDVLFLLTGTKELGGVRAWMRARGLERLETGS